NADRIGRITTAGAASEPVLLTAGSGPLDIVSGPDGLLYFTERNTDRIGRINPLAANVQASLVEFLVPGAGSGPNAIAVGPDGNIWFTEFGSDEIGRLTLAGVLTEFAVPGTGSGPAGISAGPDGALWFTEAGSGEIGRITTAGVVTNEFAVPTPVSDPENITPGPDGNLWFTETGADSVGRITAAGVITEFTPPLGAAPFDITAGPDNNLYFTEGGLDKIGRITTAGAVMEFGQGITPGAQPQGITLGPDNALWFTENAGDRIGRFGLPPVQITVASTGPTIAVYDVHFQLLRQFTPFPGFPGPTTVAVRDVNGNGVPDIIVGAGAGAGPHVKVFEGDDGSLLASFFAFAPNFTGGVFAATGAVNGDNRADLIVGAGAGAGPHVKVIDGTKLNQVQADGQIADGALLASFYAFAPNFTGGVRVAADDEN